MNTPELANGCVSMVCRRRLIELMPESPPRTPPPSLANHRLAGDEADDLVVALGKLLDGRLDGCLVDVDGEVGGFADFGLEQIQSDAGMASVSVFESL